MELSGSRFLVAGNVGIGSGMHNESQRDPSKKISQVVATKEQGEVPYAEAVGSRSAEALLELKRTLLIPRLSLSRMPYVEE